ncbi:MAG: hypothetical protein QOF76_594, partial [Solirubrobacteraceae bacterium]|nr:hypothetical protein [Solirubrobacteraceae bacterium]
MRRFGLGLLTLLGALAPATAHAVTGAPMPLSEVQPGMQCTGYSVFKGIDVETFDVKIEDIVGQSLSGEDQTRIMVTVSGPRIDPTGVGPGFSGSPVYCPAPDGSMENVGAISETIGDYGGHTVLATPIEQILATPINAPRAPKPQTRSVIADARDAAILANAKPISTPLTLAGVQPEIMRQLTKVAARQGVALLAGPSTPASRIPIRPFVPGSAVGVGLSSGAVALGATGTVAYVDGPKTWLFGHGFDTAGARSLLLQDAYVAKIINNPVSAGEDLSTYKYSGPVHDVGTVSDDGFNAVAGTTGALPPETVVRVAATDSDTDTVARTTTNVVDETGVDFPTG